MKCSEVKCKSALSKSSLPGLKYSLNPYVGCEHACGYCYAPSTLHYAGPDPWGTFVQARVNIPVVLEQEARKMPPGVVGLSTVTDPYQPAEKRYRLTRSCLEVLLAKNFPVCLQTKSALVSRDIDLLKEFEAIEVGFTITTVDDRISAVLEPGASLGSERLAAMRSLSDEGITTWAFLGPMIPGVITAENLAELICNVKDAGATRILIDRLRLKPGLQEALQPSFGGLRLTGSLSAQLRPFDSQAWEHLRKTALMLCADLGIRCEPGL